MEKIDTDYKRRNLKSLAKLFKPFNRDWAPLNRVTVHEPSRHTPNQTSREYPPGDQIKLEPRLD